MAKRKPPKKKKRPTRKKTNRSAFFWGFFFCLILGATLVATGYFVFLAPGTYNSVTPPPSQTSPLPSYKPVTAQPHYEEDLAPEVINLLPKHIKSKVSNKGSKPRIAIIIDDMGHRHNIGKQLIELDMDLSFAFLPFTGHTHSLMHLADQHGADILLHLPMEPSSQKWDPGPGGIYTSMSQSAIMAQVKKDLQDVPKAIGVNNHMGSKFTSDKQGMQAALKPIKAQSLFFIDSMTSNQSIAYQTAQEQGINTGRRDIFLDNEQNDAKIKAQLEKLVQRAKKNGTAIGIGHPYPSTLSTLKKEQWWLQNQVDIVRISELVTGN